MEELKRGLDRIHRFVEGLPFVEELG
jgi:hypothetical protein